MKTDFFLKKVIFLCFFLQLNYFKKYIFLLLLFVAPPIWAQQVLVEPYLQNPTPSSIWICWETRLGDDGRVEWGLTEELGQVTEGQAAHVHRPQDLTRWDTGQSKTRPLRQQSDRDGIFCFYTT